jgi:tRNA (cytidine/uridine-2'-O-)-methyltransferase
MILGHPHIVLVAPEIPQNTGSIARLAAGCGARLHLVPPFGFSTSDKQLRRAGLDYWPFVDLEIEPDLEDFLTRYEGRCAFLSKGGQKPYWTIPPERDVLVFGRETSGLPPDLVRRFPSAFYALPMYHPGVRSQNLSNAVAAVVYDKLRQRYERPRAPEAP